MTTADHFFDFKNQLKSVYDEREAGNITEWVFENVTGYKRWEIRQQGNTVLTKVQLEHIEKYLSELLQHRPVQYVLKEAWFYKMKFYVNEQVLIPRPETEELVEWIVNTASHKNKIIDIGTGSGCIAVALKKQLPGAQITAIDVSEKALMVAKKNAEMLHAKIEFLQLDFLDESTWDKPPQFDVMVSNPPYIPHREKEMLAKNVRDFEPGVALFVEDNDPYIFYKKIEKFAGSHLKEAGEIFVEVHEEYAESIRTIFEDAGFMAVVKKDIYGKERMIKATKHPIS